MFFVKKCDIMKKEMKITMQKRMVMELKVELAQKQTLSQQMVQSMEILQMSAQELEEYIEGLSLENPVIELDDSGRYEADHRRASRQEDLQRKLDWLESTDLQNKVYYQQERREEEARENWQSGGQRGEDLQEYLLSQLLFTEYSRKDRAAIEFMVQSLDGRGYFTEKISFVAGHFGITEEHAERLLWDIQALDPAGIGARNLQECLLLQLQRKREGMPSKEQPQEESLSEILVCRYMEEIAKNHLHGIGKELQVSMEEIAGACEEIRSLNPKPGSAFSSREQLRYISPDAIVVKLEEKFEILVNEYQYPRFSISDYYQDMMKSTQDAEAKEYLQKKVRQAEWVQNCISQRSSTLLRVVRALVEWQHDFFQFGPGHKRPMRLTDVAEELEIHESTVSRTMRGKYLQCAWGVFPLNYFLTSVAVRGDFQEEEKTPEQVKHLIRQIVEQEDKKKPCSDQAISERLGDYGVSISRRTVNKYRQEMNIPDKSGRKQWE